MPHWSSSDDQADAARNGVGSSRGTQTRGKVTADGKRRQTRSYGASCRSCSRRKIRCDTKKPTCSECIRYGEQCIYVQSVRSSAHRRQENTPTSRSSIASDEKGTKERAPIDSTSHSAHSYLNTELLRRVTQLEEELQSARRQSTTAWRGQRRSEIDDDIPGPSADSSTKKRRANGESSSEPGFGLEKRDVGLYADENSRQARTHFFAQSAHVSGAFEQLAASRLQQCQTILGSAISPALAADLLQAYFLWWNPLHMYLYRPDFYCSLVIEGPNFSSLLLNVALSQGSRLLTSGLYAARHSSIGAVPSSEHFMQQAKQCLTYEIDKGNSSALLQGLLIMSGREASCGNVDQSWLYTSMAIHVLKGLGLDKPVKEDAGSFQPLSFQKRELEHRLFWSVYCYDKTLSMTLGRQAALSAPPEMNPDDMTDESNDNTTWNPNQVEFSTVELSRPVHAAMEPSRTTAVFRKFAQLCMIIEGILNFRYSVPVPPCSRIPDLHDSLTEWEKSLEGTGITVSLICLNDSKISDPTSERACSSPQRFQLSVLYHACFIALYRPAHTKRTTQTCASDQAREYEEHAMKTCREHAGQILDLVRVRERDLGLFDLSYLVCHCLYAAMTIFVMDFSNTNAAIATEATRQLAFSIGILERCSIQSPGMIRAVQLVKAQLANPSASKLFTSEVAESEPIRSAVSDAFRVQSRVNSNPNILNQASPTSHLQSYSSAPQEARAVLGYPTGTLPGRMYPEQTAVAPLPTAWRPNQSTNSSMLPAQVETTSTPHSTASSHVDQNGNASRIDQGPLAYANQYSPQTDLSGASLVQQYHQTQGPQQEIWQGPISNGTGMDGKPYASQRQGVLTSPFATTAFAAASTSSETNAERSGMDFWIQDLLPDFPDVLSGSLATQ